MLLLYLVKHRIVTCTISAAFSIAVADTTLCFIIALKVKSLVLFCWFDFFFLKGEKKTCPELNGCFNSRLLALHRIVIFHVLV